MKPLGRFSEVYQIRFDVRAALLNAAVAIGDKSVVCCIFLSFLDVFTIASQTNRERQSALVQTMHFLREMLSTFYWLQAEEGVGPAGGGGRRAGEQEEVVGGGQENTGLPLLPLRQRSASCSHLPVRALLWAANQNDGQLLPDGGED